ncbi:MAG: hypothetical protein WD077_15010, partial [Bacteroidia bacterium]
MKKNLLSVLSCLLFLLMMPSTSEASHVMGSDISWRCVGKDSFLVTMNVYRDCNGISLSPGTISISGIGCSYSSSVSPSMSSPVDITPVCKSSCTRCSGSGCSFPYGIHRYTLTALIKLNNTNCCNFNLSWNQCCRNTNITTGASGNQYFIDAELNKCDTPCNSSPRFTNPPIAILCAGQCFIYNQGVVDDDGDSLVYTLTQPKTSASGYTNWLSPYSYDKPLYFNGFPNKNLPFTPPLCRGFHLDSFNGDLMFRPMQAQVTVMAIRVDEYRNGQKIGTIRRDLQ